VNDSGPRLLDVDRCYAAVQSRDRRFDGRFVTAVRTTGIYCRPSCPAITPKRDNVDFYPTAAAAQQRGFRACKRCRPDATPGSPDWNVRQDVVARAMRLIVDGTVERDGVAGLARRLGYSERHLSRVIADELGAGPLAIARAQRAHNARLLVETTSMTFTDIAFAAGFGSVRQFNDTMREVFASSPSELRTAAARRFGRQAAPSDRHIGGVAVALRLPVRAPFAAADVLAFIGGRAIPGVERWDGVRYERTLSLPSGPGTVSLSAADDGVSATVVVDDAADLTPAVQRLRRMLDLDADPESVDAGLSRHPVFARLVTATPGRRSPASVDPFETAVRAVIGQQVSVAGARTVAGTLVAACGPPIDVGPPVDPSVESSVAGAGAGASPGRASSCALTRRFPSPDDVAGAPDHAFAMPGARRDTIRRVAEAVADGTVELHAGADPVEARRQLLALHGIGPWTADYVIMRGLGHPDVGLTGDLGVRQALARLGLDDHDVDGAAPWRSYAIHHLWASLSTPTNQEYNR
jgi:AraC family transcriptional regulator of adaptative response / DNA-3-methyladenine glycosylase II